MPAIARNGYLYGASPQVPIDAEDVRYDNSTSELESTDVQSAIGELKELIDEGGGPQVQSDWTETDTSSDAYIQHKPTLGTASSKDSTDTISEGGTALPTAGSVYTALSGKVDAETGKGLSSNDYTDTEKTKLAGIASGAEVNVQSNWNESNTSSDAYIQNKPTLGSASSKNVPTSGNASATEVVMGSDTRLSDARNAADVYSWAKAETKPSYTAAEVGAIATTAKGANGGVAELDSTGKVPSSQLPSYVDDVLEYNSLSDFPLTGETGKIYIAKDTNKTYRWSGTAYAEISESLALGETSSTAYAGNKGKANADAIAAIKDGTNIDSFGDVETAISTLQSNFQDGVDDIYDAVVAKGTTPASKSLSDVVQGIADIETATIHTETYTASSRASNLDMGESHEYRYVDTNSVPNTNASTYEVTSNGTKDMGSTNTNRYVNVNVPNTNASTYSVDSNGIKDMGATNSYRYVNVNVPHPTHTTTYTPTSRASNLDMGATHSYRYVNTNSVPNTNSGTYTYGSGSTGGTVDMGATNTYRYVNASNVYSKGKSDMFNNVSPTLSAQNYVSGSATVDVAMSDGYILIVCSPALSVDCNTKKSQWYNSYGSIKWIVYKFQGSGTKVTFSGNGEYQLVWLLNNYIP